MDILKKPRKCVYCGEIYFECQNVGNLKCNIHPGWRVSDSDGRQYYSCCGITLNHIIRDACFDEEETMGCTPSDHVDRPFSIEGKKRIEDIKSWMLISLPSIWFVLGHIQNPTRHNLKLHIDDSKKISGYVRAKMPSFFRNKEDPLFCQIDVKDLSQKCVSLSKKYPSYNGKRNINIQMKRVNRFWNPKNVSRGMINPNNAEEETPGKTIVEESFLPFYIIRRISSEVNPVILDKCKILSNLIEDYPNI